MTRRTLWIAINAIALGLLVVFVMTRIGTSEAVDAHVYWSADLDDLYVMTSTSGDQTYQYSPAFAQALTPLRALPWEAFHAVWLSGQVIILGWLVGPIVALVLLVAPWTNVLAEVVLGNVHVVIAACVVAGMRWPAAWAFPILTKVTPGIGVLWFVGKRQWRQSAIALGVTIVITALSVALAPDAWTDWVTWLVTRPEPPANPNQLIPWAPLAARLTIAALLVLGSARLNLEWLVPFAVWLALPIIWFNSLVILAAAVPLGWPKLAGVAGRLRPIRPPAASTVPL